jgi:hypothetical protein
MYIGIIWKIHHPSLNENNFFFFFFPFGLSCWDLPNHATIGYIYNNFVTFFKWWSSIRIFNQVRKYSKYESIKKSSAPFHVVCNCRKNWRFFFKSFLWMILFKKQGICAEILYIFQIFLQNGKTLPKKILHVTPTMPLVLLRVHKGCFKMYKLMLFSFYFSRKLPTLVPTFYLNLKEPPIKIQGFFKYNRTFSLISNQLFTFQSF